MTPASSILSDFPRGHGRQSDGPSARFLTEDEVRHQTSLRFNKENTDGKFFLGVIDAGEAKRLSADESKGRVRRYTVGGQPIGVRDDRHIVTVAGSRAGKGRAVIMPNLLTYPGSMLVIDPKGELAKETAAHRASMGQTVHVLDPFGASGEVTKRFGATFNPLRLLYPGSETLVEDAGLIADALVIETPNAKDPHWDQSAKRFIETLVLHVATRSSHPKHNDDDLVSVLQLADSALNKAASDPFPKLQIDLQSNKEATGAVNAGGNDFYDRPENERASVLSSARRHLRFLGYPQMQAKLRDEGSIDLDDLKTRRTTIYLCLPAMRLGTCNRWLRLCINLALARMEEVKTKPAFPVLFCLDEFAVLGPMKAIEDAAGQLAGLDVKLWTILQDLTQLQALYEKRWETFLGNAGVLQFFGNSDLTTLEWISKRLGDTTIINESRNDTAHSQYKDGASGRSYAPAVHPLMTTDELSRFFGRDDKWLRQLIIRPGSLPLVVQRAYHDTKGGFFDAVRAHWKGK